MFETILDAVVAIVAILAVVFILFNHRLTKKYIEDYEEHKRRDAEMESKWAKLAALKEQGLTNDEVNEAVWRIMHGGDYDADAERRKDTKL